MINNKSEATGRKRIRLASVVILSAVILAVAVLVYLMNTSVSSSVYSERKDLLGRLTDSSASVICDNMEYGQSIIDIVADNAEHNIRDHGDIKSYLEEIKKRPGYEDLMFFFVDDKGKYYSSDGVSGKIVDMTYYTDSSEEKLSYISTMPHMSSEKTYLIFRNRLTEPVTTMADQSSINLEYCGILLDIDSLNNTVSQEFAGDNNTFIYDDSTGAMLYKRFDISMLISGLNIYPKFSKARVLYGEDAQALEDACRNRETVVVALEIGGEEYYFCSSPIEKTGWSIAFIVQDSYLDDVTGNAFAKIIIYIALIAGILGIAIVIVIVLAYKNDESAKSLRKAEEINEALERATKAKSDFLSNMSHDIRTPINGIVGMTTIARGVEGNPEKTRECLDRIDGASHHLLSLVNDVLDMSRIEQGRTEIMEKPIDIRTVSENCQSIVRGQMTGRDLELICEIACEHTNLIGDDLHLRQVFINILGNAVKFTRDGGKIWFRCSEIASSDSEATLRFEIEDTGIGMKPEFIERIFDEFTQDDAGARSKYKGTGLGMSIAKSLTELMGGTIEVESELNKGSKFTVTIPFAINHEEVETEHKIDVEADINGIKILLAEDNELNMDIATELLEEAGATVTPAEDGSQALEIFSASKPGDFDVILMDIMMPVMNGLEATKAIRALTREDGSTIPIIAMTANAFESDVKATIEAGMNAHLAKPINVDEMIKTIAYYAKKVEKTV